MPPKKKGGKGGKGSKGKLSAKALSPEMVDVRQYQIAASIAMERVESLRVVQVEQKSLLTDRTSKLDRSVQETDELYTYLDTQMLTSARERQGYEGQLRQAERKRKAELADLNARMELQQATASDAIRALRAELKERSDEVEKLGEYKVKGPERDAEIARLKDNLATVEQAQCTHSARTVDTQRTRSAHTRSARTERWSCGAGWSCEAGWPRPCSKRPPPTHPVPPTLRRRIKTSSHLST